MRTAKNWVVGSYVESIVKAIKSWLNKNKRRPSDVYIEDADETPTLKDEKVPTLDEHGKVLTIARVSWVGRSRW